MKRLPSPVSQRRAVSARKRAPILHEWMKAQFAERRTEPNSELGKAIYYLLNHWAKADAFFEHPDVPIDKNIVERDLKKAIQESQEHLSTI